MGPLGPYVLQGNFKHFRTLACQGPAPHPAASVAIIDTDHLIQLFVAVETNTVSLAGGLNDGWAGGGCHAGQGEQVGMNRASC